jgi:hypothetical protein
VKRFRIIDDRDGSSVLGGDVSENNVYIRTYGALLPGETPIADLAVGESALKRYALSGGKPTVYRVLRVEDET